MPGEGTRDTIPRSALNVVIVSSGDMSDKPETVGTIVEDVEDNIN